MAQPSRAEEPQRTEDSATDVEVEFTVRGNDEAIRVEMSNHLLAMGMLSAAQIVIGQGGQGKTSPARAPEEWESAFEDMGEVTVDDAYYDEVSRAVGRGTRSVLLGTSTKSLKRSLRKLKQNNTFRPMGASQVSTSGLDGDSPCFGARSARRPRGAS